MIIKKYEAKEVNEGAGVIVTRVFGFHELNDFDPFLMLDYFDHEDTLSSPGFPWHPHKGIETISYILRGEIEHQDTLGNKGVIGAGELQWMTAGKGIKHKEMPIRSEEGLEGFQFWVNLPRDKKLIDPKYQYMTNETLKVVKTDDYEVRVISGTFENELGPIDKEELGIQMLHVFSKNKIVLERTSDKNGFIFIIRGKGKIGDEEINEMTTYLLEPGEYRFEGEMEFIFAQGKPLNEPVAWYGPIVMNTKEELRQTFKDLDEDKF